MKQQTIDYVPVENNPQSQTFKDAVKLYAMKTREQDDKKIFDSHIIPIIQDELANNITYMLGYQKQHPIGLWMGTLQKIDERDMFFSSGIVLSSRQKSIKLGVKMLHNQFLFAKNHGCCEIYMMLDEKDGFMHDIMRQLRFEYREIDEAGKGKRIKAYKSVDNGQLYVT